MSYGEMDNGFNGWGAPGGEGELACLDSDRERKFLASFPYGKAQVGLGWVGGSSGIGLAHTVKSQSLTLWASITVAHWCLKAYSKN